MGWSRRFELGCEIPLVFPGAVQGGFWKLPFFVGDSHSVMKKLCVSAGAVQGPSQEPLFLPRGRRCGDGDFCL